MKYLTVIPLALLLFGCGNSTVSRSTPAADPRADVKADIEALIAENVAIAAVQYEHTLADNPGLDRVPQSVKDGELITDRIQSWISGFFAGDLWYMYELTGDEKWKTEAIKYTEALDTIQYYTRDHDVGFMINCSYGNALRLTGNEAYKPVMINAAKSLSTRFNDTVGCFSSWPTFSPWGSDEEYDYAVIIDNMMNLELLYEATKINGDESFTELADKHAVTSMEHHFRPDHSSYHVVCYDKATGAVITKHTAQGYDDESAWARGQAWGLYGYTMAYRETRKPEYLAHAVGIADYLVNHPLVPADLVPKWDYHVGQEGYAPDFAYVPGSHDDQRDVSAATIIASALLELSTMVDDGDKYYDYAYQTIKNISASKAYRATAEEKAYFLLKQSTGSIPHSTKNPSWGQIGQPLNYADYYFLEALVRLRALG